MFISHDIPFLLVQSKFWWARIQTIHIFRHGHMTIISPSKCMNIDTFTSTILLLMQQKKTRWAREPKSKTAHSKPFFPAIWRNCHDSGLTVLCTNSDVNTGGFWSHFKDRWQQPQRLTTLKHNNTETYLLSRSLPAKLSPSYLHGFLSVQHTVSLPPSEALPKLFARFPVRPACCLAPSQRSSPQAICTVSSPSSMLSRSLPAKLSPSYFHGFLSVQHAVSLPPSETLRTLFPRFPVRPACCLAPSRRSSL